MRLVLAISAAVVDFVLRTVLLKRMAAVSLENLA